MSHHRAKQCPGLIVQRVDFFALRGKYSSLRKSCSTTFCLDIPGTTIASDNVDPEWVAKPRRWNTIFIRDYMVLFGLVSTLIIIGVTLVLPYVSFSFLLGFIQLPAPLMLTMLGLTALYVLVTEVARK